MGAFAEVSSAQCWEQLQKDTRAGGTSAADTSVLIDVRTRAEWAFVGVPDLSSLGKEVLFIEWQHFGAPQPDPDFVSSLTALLGADRSLRSLFFLCRSGQRSRAAAAAAATAMAQQSSAQQSSFDCFNVADGFEGGLDENKHRGQKGGWKAAGLPWKQS